MSTPSFVHPPLPVGWTEHIGPGGQPYYFHVQTQQSTYVRPLPPFPVPVAPQPPQKKEKPAQKTPIPGTDWLRVKTTQGNLFYSNKTTKQSVWTVPAEIKEAVELLEVQEKEAEEQRKQEAAAAEEQSRKAEVERILSETQEVISKRKAEDVQPLDEVVITKKTKVEVQEDEDEDEDEDSEDGEEEEWQREAAAQLAAEAEEEKQRAEEEERRMKKEAEAEAERAKNPQLNMPTRVDLSIDEAKALFKTLLREKDINPLHPWDTVLPLFVSDPRYVLLPSVASRREAFDEYCRDRARELRQMNVKKAKEALTPAQEYEALLKEEVKSTRQSWTDFRKSFKKDRRFYGWGRDDREREKKFREFMKDLSEKKRKAAQQAEIDFFQLLREKGDVNPDSEWTQVKKGLYSDPRYDAVGSSSLREELFKTFIKGIAKGASPDVDMKPNQPQPTEDHGMGEVDEVEQERSRKERKERAVKEREEKVRAQRSMVEANIGRSKLGMNQEEGERDFRNMLIDAIRDPQATWTASLPQLQTDPRLQNSPLQQNHQMRLFHEHVGHLRSKHLSAIQSLFETHAPSLATPFSNLPVDTLLSAPSVTRMGLSEQTLKQEFDKWQRERTTASRKAFDEMLTENAFVEFWGRLGKIGGEGIGGGVKADDDEEDTEKVDMKVLAKNVDVREMEKVLKNDKRYIMFDHIPEQREQWIRDYLSQLAAPKLSVHVPDHTSS